MWSLGAFPTILCALSFFLAEYFFSSVDIVFCAYNSGLVNGTYHVYLYCVGVFGFFAWNLTCKVRMHQVPQNIDNISELFANLLSALRVFPQCCSFSPACTFMLLAVGSLGWAPLPPFPISVRALKVWWSFSSLFSWVVLSAAALTAVTLAFFCKSCLFFTIDLIQRRLASLFCRSA